MVSVFRRGLVGRLTVTEREALGDPPSASFAAVLLSAASIGAPASVVMTPPHVAALAVTPVASAMWERNTLRARQTRKAAAAWAARCARRERRRLRRTGSARSERRVVGGSMWGTRQSGSLEFMSSCLRPRYPIARGRTERQAPGAVDDDARSRLPRRRGPFRSLRWWRVGLLLRSAEESGRHPRAAPPALFAVVALGAVAPELRTRAIAGWCRSGAESRSHISRRECSGCCRRPTCPSATKDNP